MAHDHRMNEISEPWLNARNAYIEQQRMLASRNAGLGGINFDPDEENYDMAYGPADRVRRQPPASPDFQSSAENDFTGEEDRMHERRARGEN